MNGARCPHFVRHGRAEGKAGNRKLVYYDRCGLKMRANEHFACPHHPFSRTFDHSQCEVYHQVFKPGVARNDVMPTKDFQYSGTLPADSLSDMKLL